MNSNSLFSIPLIHNAVDIMTPFLLAGIGGLFTELAGMLNIALEGLILTGAFFSIVFAAATGNLLLGILLGVLCSMTLAYMFGAITLYMRANVFITGLATNLFASGFTIVLAFQLFKTKGVIQFPGIPKLPALVVPPFIQRIPVVGDILFGHNVIVYVTWAIVLLSALVIYRTPFGLRLRGTGLKADTIVSLGLNPKRYQMAGILISGRHAGWPAPCSPSSWPLSCPRYHPVGDGLPWWPSTWGTRPRGEYSLRRSFSAWRRVSPITPRAQSKCRWTSSWPCPMSSPWSP